MQRDINVSMALATFYATLHIGPKVSVNLVPAIYTSLPRAFTCNSLTGNVGDTPFNTSPKKI